MMGRFKEILRTLRYEYTYHKRTKKYKISNFEYPTENQEILHNLNKYGFAIIPNFLSLEKCNEIIIQIKEFLQQKEHENIWTDQSKADERIFNFSKFSSEVRDFYNAPFINSIIDEYEMSITKNGFTMANHIKYTEENVGSGQGWHRDCCKFKQTKAIIYLNDVNEQNGPFQYIPGSHTLSSIIKMQFKYNFDFDTYRFTSEFIDQHFKDDYIEFTGNAGTLLIVDTRGIHRGKPLESGERYALTNYLWYNNPMNKAFEKYV